jgi:5-methylcytosine-specific restriction endonuclease McrA
MKMQLKLRNQSPTKSELLNEMKRVAKKLKKNTFTQEEFNRYSKFKSFHYKRQFKDKNMGGWNNALSKAKLLVKKRQNISDKELVENMIKVWELKGEQPTRDDMNVPKFKSKFNSVTYRRRFRGWPNAVRFMSAYVNKRPSAMKKIIESSLVTKNKNVQKRSIPFSTQIKVLNRDGGFVCAICKVSKRDYPKTKFEFDHKDPVSKGGGNELKNIQILCKDCNRWKSDKK